MRKLFVCSCQDVEHQFVLEFDEEFNDSVILYIHLSSVSFFRRIVYAFEYIFGKKTKFGHGAFGEILLDKKQIKELIDSLQSCYISINQNQDVN